MKRILVPTDFSDCASLAVEEAIRLAKLNDSELYFMHYMSIPIDWIQMPANQTKMYPDVTKRVNNVRARLEGLVYRAERDGLTAHKEIVFVGDSDPVLTYIKEHDIDIVVMGSHGAHGMKEFFIGSNAQRVVRYANVPVLIIKNEVSQDKMRSIVFVSDFLATAMHSFLQILSMAEMLNAKIYLLYINTPNHFEETWLIKSRMEGFEFAASNQLAKAEIIDAHDFESGLTRYCKEVGGGIVAMVTHVQNTSQGMFETSLTEKVVNHLDYPVLSLKE